MAGIKINQYPLERLTFGDDDYYDIDYWNGTAFETAKIKGSVIKLAIQAGIVSNNLFTADLTLLANRLHDIADKSIQFDISKATGNSGNFKITNNGIVGYLYDTQIPANLTTVNQQSDAIILTADGGASATVLSIVRGEGSLSNSNNGFSFNANTKLTIITGTNGNVQIGDPTNNTNTFYNDISTNLYGIILKGFGETSETDATGANYSTLVGTSLVPKKYVDDAIASSPASNISNSNLTFGANHYIDLATFSWTLAGTSPIASEKISIQDDTRVKGSDNAEATSGFKVTDVNNDVTFDIRNNGQIGYGGVYLNTVGHKFRNPNNEAIIAAFDNDGSGGVESFIIQTEGRFKSQQSGQDIFLSYRQSGQSFIKLFDAGVESVRFNKLTSFINSDLLVGGNSIDSKARFEIQQASTTVSQQKFFANARMTTAGRLGSDTGFDATKKGFECYDTDKNKKYFWNGLAWEKIKGNIESVSVGSATIITPNIDNSEMEIVSALASTLTIAVPTGVASSFYEGKELTFRIKDNGTARLVVWDAIYEDYTGSLPNTTIANKTVYIGCKYNAVDTKWDVVAIQTQP